MGGVPLDRRRARRVSNRQITSPMMITLRTTAPTAMIPSQALRTPSPATKAHNTPMAQTIAAPRTG
jgi:hypothetical protein